MVQTVLKWKTTFYEVYSDRVVMHTGIVAKDMRSVDMGSFGQLELLKGFWGQVLNYGTIRFMYHALGPAGNIGEDFYNVSNPDKYVAQLNVMLNKATKEGGGSVPKEEKNEAKEAVDMAVQSAVAVAAVEREEPAQESVESQNQPIEGEIKF